MKLLVKNHVRDPETFETFLRGSYEVEDAQGRRLLAAHPEHVEESSEVATEAAAEEAEKAGIDLASIEGSGSGGKVTKQDVEKAKK